MISLISMAGVMVAYLLLQTVAMTVAARLARATRTQWQTGLKAALVTVICVAVLGVVFLVVVAPSGSASLATAIVLLFIQLAVAFVICVNMFRPSRPLLALAPTAAHALVAVAYVVGMQMLLWPYVTEPYRMPTDSMAPTIMPGDRFFVAKIVNPERWDCVAYVSNSEEPAIFAKRLIGLPGERLRFEDGGVWVNDRRLEAPDVLAGKLQADPPAGPRSRYRDGETIELGPDEYFFVGDNIDRSVDSRFEGPTPRSKLVGVVDVCYWPLSRLRVFR